MKYFPLQTSISAHFNRFAKLSTAVLWLWSKAKKQCAPSLKRHLFAFYKILRGTLEVNGNFPLCINLKKNNNLEEHNNYLAK